MRYLPQTDAEIRKMCETMGVRDVADLFKSIPQPFRLAELLPLENPLSEPELVKYFKALSQSNGMVENYTSFLGGGAYYHYIPSAVSFLTGRGEFATSYTPYQPEISQGTLQAVFEFQTMVASLLGLEVANASTYEGASALAEAILMALRITKRNEVLLAKSIHPEYRQVVSSTLKNLGFQIREIPWTSSGQLDLDTLKTVISKETAVVCAQSPNFFGVVEDLNSISQIAHEQKALSVSATAEAISLGLIASPGSCGVDIAVGEGQSFGNSLNLGGPYLGLFATKKEYVRQMPGRLVGETVDGQGKRGYVLTLNTREQHIRREKATSNICTNQSLCALAGAIALALLGPQGLQKMAEMNLAKAEYAKGKLLSLRGLTEPFKGPTFNEFVIDLPMPVGELLSSLQKERIFGGIALKRFYPELENSLLVCVTEMISKEQIDHLASAVEALL